MKRKNDSELVLDKEYARCKSMFNALQSAGKIIGEFEQGIWRVKGVNLDFSTPLKSEIYSGASVEINGASALLFKCFIMGYILRNKSPETIRSTLVALKLLHPFIGNSLEAWENTRAASFKQTV